MEETEQKPRTGLKWVGWSSFGMAVLQSVCSAFIALSGVRLLVGAVAFGSAVGVLKATGDRLHIDAIRMPMMMMAVPASKKSAEWIQFALAVLTLLLLAVTHRVVGSFRAAYAIGKRIIEPIRS